MDSCVEILRQQPRSENGYMRNRSGARNHLKALRTDISIDAAKEAVLALAAVARLTPAVQLPKSSLQPDTSTAARLSAPTSIVRSTNNTKPTASLSATKPSGSLAPTLVLERSDANTLPPHDATVSINDTLVKKLKQLQISSDHMLARTEAENEAAIQRKGPDLLLYEKLLVDRKKHATASPSSSATERSICQAPLLAADIIAEHYKDLVPQYGLLGSLKNGEDDLPNSQLFLNTNTNMLEMRLGLLESFLDMTGTSPDPEYRPGELTIIDLSDAFVTPSTACILFKLGLERFLQSSAPAKMLVLDEAHKYMLDTPGSKVLTNYLTAVIRLQRHQGARIVVSTQEPTIATDLVALCSVIVIHRFTSPAWYAALRRHINAVDDDKAIMEQIESLETGEALVYAPHAVLGKNEDGSLIKATGRLMKVNIRNRVTLDGGASIMAV
ncbi:hypothetical protein N0V95_005053 [Ascochyta clinopodiicola]|nr:hypothetical protein N0V95_005053 [Ascochyta clinopodiicola]